MEKLVQERKTLIVVLLTAITMAVEILFGITTGSMALLADALTSLSAIAGLIAAWILDFPLMDAIAAILSSLVIIRWSARLLDDSGKSLLDISKNSNPDR